MENEETEKNILLSPAITAEYYKQLEEEYRAIFEYSYDGIFIADGEGKVVRINKACEAMEGIEASEVVGKNVKQLVDEGYYNNSVTLEVLKKKITVTQLQRAKNGRRLMCTGVPIIKNGKVTRVVINSRDISELTLLEKKLEESRIQSEKLKTQVKLLEKEIPIDENIVYRSSKMQEIMNTVVQVAEFDSTVFLSGESGVGKEMIARMVHRRSSRNSFPFVKVDCGAIPSTLFESELFGYEKGAFTGAERGGRVGLIELSDKGTLFLDEVGELPLELQVKLLRFIQDREIMKVGGKKPKPVDTRIIAATNKDILSMVEEGLFREDLYYRLNVIPILIPPLRERREDIYALMEYFRDTFNKRFGTNKKFDLASRRAMEEYSWPGNVRELKNMIERLMVLSSGEYININDLSGSLVSGSHNGDTYHSAMERLEKDLLIGAMKGSKSLKDMANKLGLDKSSISRKLKKHGISIEYRT